jgi:hypothetical protein
MMPSVFGIEAGDLITYTATDTRQSRSKVMNSPRLLGEKLSLSFMVGPVVGNRPPSRRLPASVAIRHSDKLACGAD